MPKQTAIRATMPRRDEAAGAESSWVDSVGTDDSDLDISRSDISRPAVGLATTEWVRLLGLVSTSDTASHSGAHLSAAAGSRQLLLPHTQRAVVGTAIVLLAYALVEDREHPFVGKLSTNEAFVLLDVALPLALALLGSSLAFSLAGGVPPVEMVGIAALFALLCLAAHAVHAFVPFLVASCAGAVLPILLVSLVRSSRQTPRGNEYFVSLLVRHLQS